MKVTITARKMTMGDDFTKRIEKKLTKFNRIFSDEAEAFVTATREKNRITIEVTIRNQGMVYRAESTSQEKDEALDKVVDLLFRQIRKNKTRLEKRLRDTAFEPQNYANMPEVEEEGDFKIVRSKQFALKPEVVEEAILQMNLLGHQFYMFQNADTAQVNVIYKRKDGDYGLIEPQS